MAAFRTNSVIRRKRITSLLLICVANLFVFIYLFSPLKKSDLRSGRSRRYDEPDGSDRDHDIDIEIDVESDLEIHTYISAHKLDVVDHGVVTHYLQIYNEIGNEFRGDWNNKEWDPQVFTTTIQLAAVICGDRVDEGMTMLKSVALFSQDTHLNLILISDQKTVLQLADKVLDLKWTVQARGWDFTYEIHLGWFPDDPNTNWEAMWGQCSTQRLFFPTLLPHVDSVLYLDTDIIVVSNLTDLWDSFKIHMGDSKLAAMSPNNENTAVGWYGTRSQVPYYGEKGLNSGVMLMNLTQMRQFNFQDKAVSIYNVFKEKIELPDQDILNILFNGFPEKLLLLNCSHNFNWVHCGHEQYPCHDKEGKSYCFCRSVLQNGVQIIHGNSRTFHIPMFPHFQMIYAEFQELDLLLQPAIEFIQRLKAKFRNFNHLCDPLTAEMLFDNAEVYLKKIKFST